MGGRAKLEEVTGGIVTAIVLLLEYDQLWNIYYYMYAEEKRLKKGPNIE